LAKILVNLHEINDSDFYTTLLIEVYFKINNTTNDLEVSLYKSSSPYAEDLKKRGNKGILKK